jgi:hypothetical protein
MADLSGDLHMDLGAIYGGLTLSGIEVEVEEIDFGDLGDYGARKSRNAARNAARSASLAERVAGRRRREPSETSRKKAQAS